MSYAACVAVTGSARTPEELFDGHPEGLTIYRAVADTISTIADDSRIRVTKSQIAFRRAKAFAFVWRPAQYVSSAVPAVLSIGLPRKIDSGRFKSVVHPSARVWMHHLELHRPGEVDAEVRSWLAEAAANAT
jgi:hypothetical protein